MAGKSGKPAWRMLPDSAPASGVSKIDDFVANQPSLDKPNRNDNGKGLRGSDTFPLAAPPPPVKHHRFSDDSVRAPPSILEKAPSALSHGSDEPMSAPGSPKSRDAAKQRRVNSPFTEEAIPMFVVLKIRDSELEETAQVNLQRFPISSELMMTPDGDIMAGSFTQLIIYLTDPDTVNPDFQQQFLLTFPSFTTERNVLAALFMRFFANPNNPKVNVKEDKLKYVRDRIVGILTSWFYMTSEFSQIVREAVLTFSEVLKKIPANSWFQAVLHTSARVFQTENDRRRAPSMILPKTPEPWGLLDIPPVELARHLTIIHWEIFSAITPELLLREIWGEHAEALTAILKRLTGHFNRLASAITKSILDPVTIQDRAAAYCHWVEVAIQLHELRNYNGLFCTMLGLQHRSVVRLTDTTAYATKKLDKKRKKAFALLSNLCQIDNDYQVYREEITGAAPPSIPFIGCFQKDMVYIGESYPNTVEGLINFSKCRVSVKLVNGMTRFQNARYHFDRHPQLIRLLSDLPEEVDLMELMKLSMSRENKKK